MANGRKVFLLGVCGSPAERRLRPEGRYEWGRVSELCLRDHRTLHSMRGASETSVLAIHVRDDLRDRNHSDVIGDLAKGGESSYPSAIQSVQPPTRTLGPHLHSGRYLNGDIARVQLGLLGPNSGSVSLLLSGDSSRSQDGYHTKHSLHYGCARGNSRRPVGPRHARPPMMKGAMVQPASAPDKREAVPAAVVADYRRCLRFKAGEVQP
jgi:hypothetical protein